MVRIRSLQYLFKDFPPESVFGKLATTIAGKINSGEKSEIREAILRQVTCQNIAKGKAVNEQSNRQFGGCSRASNEHNAGFFFHLAL